MARPKTFDERQALDSALDCFWRRGYGATSIRDLAAEMGIGSASLYNAFSDKRSLFIRVLDRYVELTTRERFAQLEAAMPPKAAVRAFVTNIVERSISDPRGCLLVNSALELAPRDRALRTEIARRLGEIEEFLRRNIAQAQRAGTVPAKRNARELAKLLLSVLLGLRVLARAKPDPKLIRDIARPALALLD